MTTSTRIVLASRPTGAPTAENFRTETADLPEVGDGQVLLKVLYLSLDPYMRGRMSDAESYAEPVAVDGVMCGGTVAEVVESRSDALPVGSVVLSYSGWQTHEVVDASSVRRLDPDRAPISTAVGVLGMPGFTAYAGMTVIGQPKEGETVVVAAASGPVGSAVGQFAKIKGARAVGIAGGPEKCAYLIDELGFDAAVDHRADDFREQLAAATPDGIDVYFENVGGAVARAVLPRLNLYARVPVCGLIAQYNDTQAPEGPDRLPGFFTRVLTKSLTVRGFIQSEFVGEHYKNFQREVSEWIADGRFRYREDVVEGLENAPDAFFGLLEGRNFGKLVVKVADRD
ncbi:NADP-dependent oxidoreductase [Rhodococcoides corynebacterioides]|uniref:NADP-dependent oxidoreductase n=1 Tax=Rhodococcoides corynebacterioides TaxID=53972 RepID=A0ABS7P0Q9_9NOCA|nr:NADP-dependent oxidoreductase [Rhodococcus corynebacterioides]MBY6365636.1 NADP-dependent oxidoreductase [Rhodococcus corynebacterioides]MBY6406367.1 NADP-dependent oxidoreductase [Rhodococcus corynebacterioides]